MSKKEVKDSPIPINLPGDVNLREGNISLILDGYDDIFSDFDPRGFHERALSNDFLDECRNASRDKKEGEIEIRLLIQKHKRKIHEEIKIRRRLREHFLKHHHQKLDEQKRLRKEGILWFGLGSFLIMTAVLLTDREGIFARILTVIFEPAGWFTAWTGLEKVFLDTREKNTDLEFYAKMAKARISFFSY